MRRDLAALVASRAPFLSIYLDLSPGEARATAPARLQTELERIRGLLESSGHGFDAFAALFDHVLAEIEGAPDDDALLVAIGSADGTTLTSTYPDPPRHDVVAVSDVPRLGPLLAAEQNLTHHVVAVVDGAEVTLTTVPRHGEATQSSYAGTDPLAVAPVVQHACRTSGTRLLIVCAHPDELPTVTEQIRSGLPVTVSLATVPLDHLDIAHLATEIVVRTAHHAAAKTVELLQLYRFHQSHHETADGTAATCAALADGRAALVLVNDDEDDDRQGWLAPGGPGAPLLVGLGLPEAGGGHRAGRLADVVISAAVYSGCGVHLVPSVDRTLNDGFGVVLADRADPGELAELLER